MPALPVCASGGLASCLAWWHRALNVHDLLWPAITPNTLHVLTAWALRWQRSQSNLRLGLRNTALWAAIPFSAPSHFGYTSGSVLLSTIAVPMAEPPTSTSTIHFVGSAGAMWSVPIASSLYRDLRRTYIIEKVLSARRDPSICVYRTRYSSM
jgi:hypothetical protein